MSNNVHSGQLNKMVPLPFAAKCGIPSMPGYPGTPTQTVPSNSSKQESESSARAESSKQLARVVPHHSRTRTWPITHARARGPAPGRKPLSTLLFASDANRNWSQHTQQAACSMRVHSRTRTWSRARKPLSTLLKPYLGPMSPTVTPGRGLQAGGRTTGHWCEWLGCPNACEPCIKFAQAKVQMRTHRNHRSDGKELFDTNVLLPPVRLHPSISTQPMGSDAHAHATSWQPALPCRGNHLWSSRLRSCMMKPCGP